MVQQNPSPGHPGLQGTTVILIVSARAERTTVEVPDLVGLDGAQARAALEEVGLHVEQTRRRAMASRHVVVRT